MFDDRILINPFDMTLFGRLDCEKHSAVCRNCESGWRPVSPESWPAPQPCPLCQFSNKEKDSLLLARYKVNLTVSWEVSQIFL